MTGTSDLRTVQGTAGRTPDEIERDIADVRARMDRTLDELEFRLSPGQMVSGGVDWIQEMFRGDPGRYGEVIRRNPIPVVLIAIGVVWLGLAVSRTRPRTGFSEHDVPSLEPDEATAVLMPLWTVTRQGAEVLRQAESALHEPQLQVLVRDMAEQQDRAAAALELEIGRHGGAIGDSGAEPPHAGWAELRRAIGAHDTRAIVRGVEAGADATLDAFRQALHHDLPTDLRVLVGAHFHANEQMHNRLSAVQQAYA